MMVQGIVSCVLFYFIFFLFENGRSPGLVDDLVDDSMDDGC
jgi:hypothetical protein